MVEVGTSWLVRMEWRPSGWSVCLPLLFTRLHRCAPPSNTCSLGSTRFHIPNGISIGSAVFAQLTAQNPYTLQPMGCTVSSSKLPLARRHLNHLVRASLGPPEPTTHDISIGSAIFAQLRAASPCTLQWDAPFASKLTVASRDLDSI